MKAIYYMAVIATIITSCTLSKDNETLPDNKVEYALNLYTREAKSASLPIDAILVMQHGNVIGERYLNGWQKSDSHHMWSASKSFTSIAVGMAANEGLLSLDDKVCNYFPEYYSKHIDESPEGTNIANGTIRDYLVMATGQELDASTVAFSLAMEQEPDLEIDDNLTNLPEYYDARGKNLIEDLFVVPFTQEPGTFNCYNSFATYVLAAIVQKVTNETMVDYLDSRLWKPLGIAKPVWNSVNGVNCGGWGLNLNAEEMAKFGQLLLDSGQKDGKQIIPSSYLASATTPFFTWDAPETAAKDEAKAYPTGYGYQFWTNGEGFLASGARGQYIVVLPKYDAVIVAIADIKESRDQEELNLIWRYILPELRRRLANE